MPLSHPVCFSFPFFSTTQPLFFLFSRESSVEIVKFWASEPTPSPSLKLVWAQNQPNFRSNRQNARNFAENPCPHVVPGYSPCDRLGILSISSILPHSDFAPDQLSDSGKLASFQNGAPNTQNKHPLFSWKFSETQRPKCWGPCFPFCLPENLGQPKR